MRKTIACALMALTVAVFAAGQLRAQDAPKPMTPPQPLPKLVFDREVFEYPVSSRRDPFRPLTTDDTQGPLFTELTLTGVIVQQDPSESIAMVRDLSKKTYRLHRGDSAGNATVIDIAPTRVVFSIAEFGMKRTEVLELKTSRAGDK